MLIGAVQVHGQCHEQVRAEALQSAGIDAFFLQELPVRLKAGTMKSPVRFRKFRTQLDSGVTYRVSVVNNPDFEGKVIMQLLDRNEILGSTFDLNSKVDHQQFDYTPLATKTYTLISSFREGKRGCALGILSMVVKDSLAVLDHRVTSDSIQETLYLGMPNPVRVAMADVEGGYMEVEMTSGEISYENGQYYARPFNKGTSSIISKTYRADSTLVETDTTVFRIEELPIPYPSLKGFAGGYVGRNELFKLREIALEWYTPFDVNLIEVIDLIVSTDQMGVNSSRTKGTVLSQSQKRLINSLASDESFYIQVRVKLPDGSVKLSEPVKFTVY